MLKSGGYIYFAQPAHPLWPLRQCSNFMTAWRGPSKGLLHDCKTSPNLREPSFEGGLCWGWLTVPTWPLLQHPHPHSAPRQLHRRGDADDAAADHDGRHGLAGLGATFQSYCSMCLGRWKISVCSQWYSTSVSEKMPMKWKVFLNIPIFKVHIFPPVKWQGSRAEADTQTGDE